jgi:hypothetical protein
MADIQATKSNRADGYEFQVIVREHGGETQHRVTLKETDYQRLVAGQATPEELVAESFRFLLEREPKESILSSFDLTAISRYFPEYERLIRKRL